MLISNSLVADSEQFRDMTDGERVLDYVEARFRSLGATHFLATGLPMPGRPLEPLVLRVRWGGLDSVGFQEANVNTSDPVFQLTLGARRAFFVFERREHERVAEGSPLIRWVGHPSHVRLLGVPIQAFLPYQGCVLGAGASLELDNRMMLAMDYFCTEAFRRLMELGTIRPGRPGELSARERRVVELSAIGKTAAEIAGVLRISQRTVHAHLQNSSAKLRASNKTQTVVEALRYGQISI